MSTEGPKPYPVVFDPESGLQYSYQTGYENITVPTPTDVTVEDINSEASTSGQVIESNGDGTASWATPTAATPAGADTQIQFNNAGSFGASANLVWNGSLGTVAMHSITDASNGFVFTNLDGSIPIIGIDTLNHVLRSYSDGVGAQINFFASDLSSQLGGLNFSEDGSLFRINNASGDLSLYTNTNNVLLQTANGVNTWNFNQSGVLTMPGDVDLATHQIHNVVDPTSAQDAATKNYVDSLAGSVTPPFTKQAISTEFTSSTTYVASTAWTGAFALTHAGNKVKVSLSIQVEVTGGANDGAFITVFRDGVDLGLDTFGFGYVQNSGSDTGTPVYQTYIVSISSPGDTASHTYTYNYKTTGSGTVDFGNGTGTITMMIEEIPV